MLMLGVLELVNIMCWLGVMVILVLGGFMFFIKRVVCVCGFDFD